MLVEGELGNSNSRAGTPGQWVLRAPHPPVGEGHPMELRVRVPWVATRE